MKTASTAAAPARHARGASPLYIQVTLISAPALYFAVTD